MVSDVGPRIVGHEGGAIGVQQVSNGWAFLDSDVQPRHPPLSVTLTPIPRSNRIHSRGVGDGVDLDVGTVGDPGDGDDRSRRARR